MVFNYLLSGISKIYLIMQSSIATVADLIEHLRKLDPESELAFFDEGGAWCEVYGMPAGFLGSIVLCEASERKAEDKKHMPED